MDALAELESFVASLSASDKAELDATIAQELSAVWLPETENRPQCAAYVSLADELLFGGSPGAGKTDLIVGLALTEHYQSVIFRANLDDMAGIKSRLIELAGPKGFSAKGLKRRDRVIEFGHLSQPKSELGWQGRPKDLICFDEGAQLAKAKVMFVMGWLRSTRPGQRCRVVIASNPPTGGEGEWLIEWYEPWLDPKFPDPAQPGELRLFVVAPDANSTTIWVKDAAPVIFTEGLNYRLATPSEIEANRTDPNPRLATPKTRTFIPGWLKNNPYLANTGYGAQLQRLPEPLRTQMIRGDFLAGRRDHLWQVIPTDWVRAAMSRWTPTPPNNAMMTAVAADIAQGGGDSSTIAARHGPWFAPVLKRPGIETPKPSDVAGMIVSVRRQNAIVIVDMGGGYGGGVKERLEDNGIEVRPFNGANTSDERTADKTLSFVNDRARATWRFREALDPDQDGGSQIALQPDPEVLGDLTSLRWKLMSGGILIENKEELRKPERLGRSPDKGDAIIMAWSEGEKAIIAIQKKRDRSKPIVPVPAMQGIEPGTGWLRR